ncbi:hypothetical protein MPH_05769 [Macrophomina phaseolina MS6]|uniref:Uncharacterized protein n=2 Tax=Macrophomina phaseolina TaxID=35725 RepID=K2S3M2_MACPH|nr:hypothetical protein MPH_05769 [Macrophomina phaseolina MS6]KAH7049284.1 hypothetical protein B0J12DRAFT_785979 [Macrophomina phaseolina]
MAENTAKEGKSLRTPPGTDPGTAPDDFSSGDDGSNAKTSIHGDANQSPSGGKSKEIDSLNCPQPEETSIASDTPNSDTDQCTDRVASDGPSMSELSTEEEPLVGATIEEVLRQIRRIEAEVHAKNESERLLDALQLGKLNAVLHLMDRSGPFMCLRLQEPLLTELQDFFHTLTLLAGDYRGADVSAVLQTALFFFDMHVHHVRALLGSRDHIRFQRRCNFLDWYIELYKAELATLPGSKMPEYMTLKIQCCNALTNHYLLKTPHEKIDCWMDAIVVSFIRRMSPLHAIAFKRIYGIDAASVAVALQTPGMRHVLDLHGIYHVCKHLFDTKNTKHYRATVKNVSNSIGLWAKIAFGAGTTKDEVMLGLVLKELATLNIDNFLDYRVRRAQPPRGRRRDGRPSAHLRTRSREIKVKLRSASLDTFKRIVPDKSM